MNDLMSLGIHRLWKEKFINWMNPQPNTKLIDVASGTGDIAKLFFMKTKKTGEITCIEPNKNMLEQGQKRLKKNSNINSFFMIYFFLIICFLFLPNLHHLHK